MSAAVEIRLLELLSHPTVSPFGNPIPGLEEIDPTYAKSRDSDFKVISIVEVVESEPRQVTIRRLAETIQHDGVVMARLRRVGALPGARVNAYRSETGVFIGSAGEYTEVPIDEAAHIFISI
jgi:DtxR family Mn-dependent transcriptional regulator